MGDDNERKWSIVMSGFSGNWVEFGERAKRAFGRDGLDSFSLALFTNEHLPSEIADGLSSEKAERIAAELRETGAEVSVLPTEQVANVYYRASEVWPTRCVGDTCFTEIDGMILSPSPINARENLALMRKLSPCLKAWELERSVNHFHPGIGESVDEEIAIQVAEAESLESDLRDAYPDRAFTISQVPGHQQMSYWQTSLDSPREQFSYIEPSGKPWCWNCSRPREFEPGTYVDPRFPPLEWGKCKECGERIIVRSFEKLTFIEPVTSSG